MKKFFIVPVVLSLAACGTVKTATEVELKAPSFSSTQENYEEVKYPKWYVEKDSDGALYSVATEYSGDFQFAVDKAMLSAKRELASNFSSHINAMMKDYAAEVGEKNNDVIREIDRTTKLVVAKVNLVGVQRTNLKVQHEYPGYRAYVKLRYASDDSNKVLVDVIRKNKALNAKLGASKSFQELEQNADKVSNVEITRVQ
jgi:hypothetical protein